MKQIKYFDVPQYKTLQEMLINSAADFGDKLALEDIKETPIKRATYNELLDYVLRFGKALQDTELLERTHVALIGENRVQWAIAYLTVTAFNMVVVPIDKNLHENEILNIIHESDAEAVIFSDTYSSLFSEEHFALKRIKTFVCMDETDANEKFMIMKEMIDSEENVDKSIFPEINDEEVSEIIFTSGSLGHAKGVMLTQKNLVSNLHDMLSMIQMLPSDRFLSVLPIHHTYECTCGMLCPLYSGSSVHYTRSLKTIVDDMNKVHATLMLGVPLLFDKMYKGITKAIEADKTKSKVVPVLQKITNVAEKIGFKSVKKKIFKEVHDKFGGSIRLFIAGGAAPDPAVAKGLREFGFNFLQGYGLTETSPILAVNRLDAFKDDAAGLPLPSVKLKINNPNPDGIGEVFAKGPNIMKGYYKNEELTKEAFEDGWFKTGDIGFIDEDGFLHINGRAKNVIISKSGKNVFPEEIEELLNRSEFILESAVYGAKDKKQGELITAQIVPDSEAFMKYAEENGIKLTDEVIYNKIKEEVDAANRILTSYKRIQKFIVREHEFEKTTTHKIKRHLLNKD